LFFVSRSGTAPKSLNQIKEALKRAKGKELESLRKAKKLLEQADRLLRKNL